MILSFHQDTNTLICLNQKSIYLYLLVLHQSWCKICQLYDKPKPSINRHLFHKKYFNEVRKQYNELFWRQNLLFHSDYTSIAKGHAIKIEESVGWTFGHTEKNWFSLVHLCKQDISQERIFTVPGSNVTFWLNFLNNTFLKSGTFLWHLSFSFF